MGFARRGSNPLECIILLLDCQMCCHCFLDLLLFWSFSGKPIMGMVVCRSKTSERGGLVSTRREKCDFEAA
jgi:hypothetical protein